LLERLTSEIAVRYWAVVCATLVVPAVSILGTQLFDRRVGLVAALLAAVNPFVQWWGQDAHFYAYLLAVATLLTVVTLRFWRSTELASGRFRRVGALYVLVALISFLAHYFAIRKRINIVAAVQTPRRRWSRTAWWGAQAVPSPSIYPG
jgi:uncharacterized membrane protein